MTTTPTIVELRLGGMTCASCAARIEKRLNRLDGVEAQVNYATETATVVADPTVATDELIGAVQAIGYTATLAAPTADTDGAGAGRSDGHVDEHDARLRAMRQRLLVSHRADGAGAGAGDGPPRCSSTAGSGCR